MAGEAGRGGWVLNVCTREDSGSREKSHKEVQVVVGGVLQVPG